VLVGRGGKEGHWGLGKGSSGAVDSEYGASEGKFAATDKKLPFQVRGLSLH
jgi:hypothetical protein